MTNREGGAPVGAFFDSGEAENYAKDLLRRTEDFHRRLAVSAFSAGDQERLLPLVAKIEEGIARTKQDLEVLEEKEPFGGEESYWNMFRFFCCEPNRQSVLSTEQVWNHLAKSFDMSAETIETLNDTIEEWRDDVAADAKEKFRVIGELTYAESGWVFIIQDILPKTVVAKKPVYTPKEILEITSKPPVFEDMPAATELSVETPLCNVIEELSELLIAENVTSIRQPELIAAVLRQSPTMNHETVLEEINALNAAGRLFKYKPAKGGAARITLDETVMLAERKEDVTALESNRAQQNSGENDVDPKEVDSLIAQNVVLDLIGTLTHVQEMKPANIVCRDLGESIDGVTSADIKTVIRELSSLGILRLDQGSPLSGRRKGMSRSKRNNVMRVGILDQQMKELLKDKLSEGSFKQWFAEIRAVANES